MLSHLLIAIFPPYKMTLALKRVSKHGCHCKHKSDSMHARRLVCAINMMCLFHD